MSAPIQIAHNAIIAQLLNADKPACDIVSTLLSYFVEGHEFMSSFQSKHWDGRTSFFGAMKNTFPAGFVHLVHQELVSKGYSVSLVRKPLPVPTGPESPIVDKFGNDDPRYDYQLKALRQVERHGRGILQVATGGGKSKIAKLIVARYRKPTLFLTTRGSLMYQMGEGFSDAGMNVGYLGDGTWAPVRGVNCGMVQTLVARLEETNLDAEVRYFRAQSIKKELNLTKEQIQELAEARFAEKSKVRNDTIAILQMFEVVIGEEAHEAGGNSYFKILQHCNNAHIRVALTATPFMRENSEDNMRLMAAFGPILLKVSEKLLIDRGILAKPYFKYIDAQAHPKLRKTSPWERARVYGIVENMYRNAHIIREASRAIKCGLPVMILIGLKGHGAYMEKAFNARGVSAKFIYGDNKQSERKKALKDLASGKIQVLIGTTILDVGIDVPAVGLVILAGGGKAEVALRQRIGRGAREKKFGPNVFFVVDFTDSLNATLRDHARARRRIVEDTPGFSEGILPEGADFPWELFTNDSKAA